MRAEIRFQLGTLQITHYFRLSRWFPSLRTLLKICLELSPFGLSAGSHRMTQPFRFENSSSIVDTRKLDGHTLYSTDSHKVLSHFISLSTSLFVLSLFVALFSSLSHSFPFQLQFLTCQCNRYTFEKWHIHMPIKWWKIPHANDHSTCTCGRPTPWIPSTKADSISEQMQSDKFVQFRRIAVLPWFTHNLETLVSKFESSSYVIHFQS
jgi:hypothetical protein